MPEDVQRTNLHKKGERNNGMKTIEVHELTFGIIKIDKEWQTRYKEALATRGTTRKEAIDNLQNLDKDWLAENCASHDEKLAKNEYFGTNQKRFEKVFGFAPPKDLLLYYLTGFLSLDVIKLDRLLHTPDETSTKDYIEGKFGTAAMTMIEQMI